MPFRTRDFLVFSGLLVVIIALTAGYFRLPINLTSEVGQEATVIFATQENSEEYKVMVEEVEGIDREALRLAMKEKVKGRVIKLPEALVEEDIVVESVDNTKIQKCVHYAPYQGAWNPSGLLFEVVEGARLVYRPGVSDISGALTKDVVVQLPLLAWPESEKSCLATDVVGIASKGSLIRNDENKLYSIFSETTLLGYALDGFPIYGLSERETDECGGAMVFGEYRYFLSLERSGVIGCFSGNPVYW